MPSLKVGFIGLGKMGSAMAGRLIQAGHSLTVYNRTAKLAEPLAALGARIAASPRDAAIDAQFVITMLANDEALRAVTQGEDGLMAAMQSSATHLSMSTISPSLSEEMAERHSQRGVGYVGAPVLGRADSAEAGTLFILAGGDAVLIEACSPLLEAMGQKTFAISERPEVAHLCKVLVNFLLFTNIEAMAEACSVAGPLGLEPRAFIDVLTQTLFATPAHKHYGGMIAEGRDEPVLMKLSLALKDVMLGQALAKTAGVPLPLAAAIADRMQSAINVGHAEQDVATLGIFACQPSANRRVR